MIELLMIGHAGRLQDGTDPPPGLPAQVCAAYGQLYAKAHAVGPWMGYLARRAGLYVGTCGFKGPPVDNRVEIAYFTFPEFEGRGIATAMAEQLVRLVRQEAPHVIVTARTLPEYGASTRILRRLRFRNAGVVIDPEDGQVWEWVLDGDRPAPAPGAASSEV